MNKERWKYLKQDLLKLKGTYRYIVTGKVTFAPGFNKKIGPSKIPTQRKLMRDQVYGK